MLPGPHRITVLVIVAVAVVWTGGVDARQRGRAARPSAPAATPEQLPREGGLRPGDAAPDFTLDARGGGSITLSSFRGRQPVALVFGSYT
jgi:hypothetical protein